MRIFHSAYGRPHGTSWLRIAPAIALLVLFIQGTGPALAEPKAKSELEHRIYLSAVALEHHPDFKGMSLKEREEHVEFVTGNILFVLGHETGHAVISEMGIPVIGREEDAADIFSTLTALKVGSAFAERVLANSAKGWFLSDLRSQKDGNKVPSYDIHGMDLQRAYNVVCLMVGSDQEKFKSLADDVKMPEDRQVSCQGDYSNASWSWEKVVAPHLRKPDQPKTKIDIVYGDGKGLFDDFANCFRNQKILEAVAEMLEDRYVWRAPISLEFQTCGESGARWDLPTKKVIVCYEIAAEFSQLFRTYGHTTWVAAIPDDLSAVQAGQGITHKAFRPSRAPQ